MAIDKKSLGKKIRNARLKKSYSQTELAQQASISPKYLERIEVGERAPSLDVLVILADITDASLDILLGESRKRKRFETQSRLLSDLEDCNDRETAFLLDVLVYIKGKLRETE